MTANDAPAARAAGDQPSRLVLCLVPGLGNSFWNVIINAVEETVLAGGCGVIFGDTRNDPLRQAHYDRLIATGQVRGILVFTGRMPLERARLDAMGIPVTLVSNEIEEIDDVPVFDVANRDAARSMVEYLIGVGHRRIAHIVGSEGNVEAAERLRGYFDALAGSGIEADPALVWQANFSIVGGARAAQRYLALENRPTAIFAASDELALGCISALKEAGVGVPENVSVAGFDGIEISAIFNPALTTMLQPRAELGRLAAENLISRIGRAAGNSAPVKRTRLQCTLVVRDSVAPVGVVDAETLRRLAVSEPAVRGRKAGA
jgi:LacI family transcriptional regulator, repressor for deo operon, udp, cdd, tsx, nupC, and nupG